MPWVRGMLKSLAAAALVAATCVTCGSSPHEGASITAFCASADSVLNKGAFASDGGGVVDSLRRLDLRDLPGVDQEKVSTAVDIVEANIAAFDSGQAPDGWSTEPVAALATRICGADMTSFHVVP